MSHEGISIISAKTEERPRYFEFKKSHFIGAHPTMATLDYDPFPEAKSGDVVRREIIGRELVLVAKLKAPPSAIRLGIALELDGHRFALKAVTEHIDVEGGESIFEVEGIEPLTPCEEPLEVLARLRRAFAAK